MAQLEGRHQVCIWKSLMQLDNTTTNQNNTRLRVFPTATIHVNCVRNLKVIVSSIYHTNRITATICWSWNIGSVFVGDHEGARNIFIFICAYRQHLDRGCLILSYWVKLSHRSKLLPCGPPCSCKQYITNRETHCVFLIGLPTPSVSNKGHLLAACQTPLFWV